MRRPHRHALGIGLSAALVLAAGCGSDEEAETTPPPAPTASDFPAADGRTVAEVFASATPSDDVVVSPTGQVFNKGENRYGFGVFTAGRQPIRDAEVALYVGPPKSAAKGPFPARVEDMSTEAAFASTSTTGDPDAAEVVYASDIDVDKRGRNDVVALIREGEALQAVRVPSIDVGKFSDVPVAGDKAPAIDTPTADEVADLDEIDTRDPHGTMHEESFADVVGKEPAVLVFATPLLCQSRVCGPVVDIAEQVKAEHGDQAAFIHQEIFEDNEVDKGLREQVLDYRLPTEPWIYVVDGDGVISTAIEGAFSAAELEDAVQKVTG